MTEYYDVVDEQDRIIGKASREECHQKGLIHRTAHVLVFLTDGRLVLQKRSNSVDTYPGRFTSSASGHVASGESYEEAAQRELKEELGIDAPLEKLGFVTNYNPQHMQHIMVFKAVSDGPYKRQKGAIRGLVILDTKQLHKEILENPDQFTPAFRDVYTNIF